MGSRKNLLELAAMALVAILVVLVVVKVVAILLSSVFVIVAFGLGYLVGRYRKHKAERKDDSNEAPDE